MKKNIKIDNISLFLTNTPVGKAYLQLLLHHKMVPSKIVYLDWTNIKKSDSFFLKIYKKLPTYIQLSFFILHFKRILNKNEFRFNIFTDVKTTLKKHKLDYISIKCDSINDKNVVKLIREMNEDILIYTSGGIVRKELFNTGKKVLHIHPGYLPYVRGSNGLLWSILVRDKPGFTCFFMNEGIDTGDIIMKKEYINPIIKKQKFLSFFLPRKIDLLFTQFALEYYFDSYHRALLLIDVLSLYIETNDIKSEKQDLDEGKTYYMKDMNLGVLTRIIEKLIESR